MEKIKVLKIKFFWFLFFLSLSFFIAPKAGAATLFVNPPQGSFLVGGTFDVSILLNTEGEKINAVSASLTFPTDKLQLVSPSSGNSIISIWTTLPYFDNKMGRVDLQGGIQGGINVKDGLLATLTFRVKSIGSAVIKFTDNSKTLLHDGLGTDVLHQTMNGVYQLTLPPPEGPIVESKTHPDQSKWYKSSNVAFSWKPSSNVDGYSYVLNDTPVDIPDDILDGNKTGVTYKNISDGIHYFHIKALKDSQWGGTTHFAAKIDSTPPADFPIEIIPSPRTTRHQPVIQFETTDAFSGVEHYELKLVPMSVNKSDKDAVVQNQPFFIEVQNPYISQSLPFGAYDVIIRAYDNAGNYAETTRRMTIVNPIFRFIQNTGIEINNVIVIPWIWIWIVAAVILVFLAHLCWRAKAWHHHIHTQNDSKKLPPDVLRQLEELKLYQSKYGGKMMALLVICGFLLFGNAAFAADELNLPDIIPPIIFNVSKDLSNEEIFYVGGKTEKANTDVIIYLQNEDTGEIFNQQVASDRRGDWFYRHSKFLTSGRYFLWVQAKIDSNLSPPSPQVKIVVRPMAIQFGGSRISSEFLYLILLIIFALAFFVMMAYILIHTYHGHKKQKVFLKEVLEAENSVRRGFAVLRRDIEAELSVIHKAKLSRPLEAEETEKERTILKDLEDVEKYIGKEIWDIERAIKIDELEKI